MAKRAVRTTVRKPSVESNPIEATAAAGQPNGRPTEEEVRVRAYHRYLERGAGHGSDFDDWVEAEKELKVERRS